MAIKKYVMHVCDLCAFEYRAENVHDTELNWMFRTRKGGSCTSDAKHFCPDCTDSFKLWLESRKSL